MQLFSGDSFFIVGITSLLIDLNISEPEGLIIFDTGQDYIYVLDEDDMKYIVISDPLSAFIICRRSLIDRAAKISVFSKMLSGWRFGRAKRRPEKLTIREALILRMIFLGITQKQIAKILDLNEKTVSAHKLNALHKLKIKNIAIFFSEYAAWYRLWKQYVAGRKVEIEKRQASITEQLAIFKSLELALTFREA